MFKEIRNLIYFLRFIPPIAALHWGVISVGSHLILRIETAAFQTKIIMRLPCNIDNAHYDRCLVQQKRRFLPNAANRG